MYLVKKLRSQWISLQVNFITKKMEHTNVAEMGIMKRAVYATSKGAVLALTKAMQVDYAPYNIRVNELLLGTILTPFVEAGDVMVLTGRGPSGSGKEETAQLTAALKYLPFGKHVCLITDARFSGFSTGACIGHVGPEALDEGPIGKLRDGELIEVIIDLNQLEGTVNFIGNEEKIVSREEGALTLANRSSHPNLAADPDLPDDTKLRAALQSISGGTWRGSVYDVGRILEVIEAGKKL